MNVWPYLVILLLFHITIFGSFILHRLACSCWWSLRAALLFKRVRVLALWSRADVISNIKILIQLWAWWNDLKRFLNDNSSEIKKLILFSQIITFFFVYLICWRRFLIDLFIDISCTWLYKVGLEIGILLGFLVWKVWNSNF